MTTAPDPAPATPAAVDQAALWNGPAGHAWVDAQDTLDRMFQGFETRIAEAVQQGRGAHVLDVGCGTGATTLAVARQVGERGAAVGVDLSAPMLARARERAAAAGLPATFEQADAGTHAFPPARFDRIVSRFGVMFFADPAAAFANLRAAARPGAALDAFAWRAPADNPFMTAAERAAAPFLASMPARDPHARPASSPSPTLTGSPASCRRAAGAGSSLSPSTWRAGSRKPDWWATSPGSDPSASP
ncbi:class I SAM-dependent methyltransferase [Amorphus sp. MBR-141]